MHGWTRTGAYGKTASDISIPVCSSSISLSWDFCLENREHVLSAQSHPACFWNNSSAFISRVSNLWCTASRRACSTSRTPLRVWLAAAWYLTNQKQGVNALRLQRVLGLGTYQTALTRLHRRVVTGCYRQPLWGGRHKATKREQKAPACAARCLQDEQIVVGRCVVGHPVG